MINILKCWHLNLATGLILLVISGCEQPPAPVGVSQKETDNVTHYDFGEIYIDQQAELKHTFIVKNIQNEPYEVLKISQTCGCVSADLDASIIQPGESAQLKVILQANSSGPILQHVTLVCSDDKIRQFSLAAYGKISHKLLPVLQNSVVSIDNKLLPGIQLYLIDAEGPGESETPIVVEPEDVGVIFSSWATLEKYDKQRTRGRPTRQVANITLDFTQYAGEYPVLIKLQIESGATCSFYVRESDT